MFSWLVELSFGFFLELLNKAMPPINNNNRIRKYPGEPSGLLVEALTQSVMQFNPTITSIITPKNFFIMNCIG